jgi:starvation-inducible DNA-binding protein
MSQRDDYPPLHTTRIDIPLEIRVYLTTMLNQTLACTLDLRSQVKQAAWNVKGSAFMQLHTLFHTIADELDAYTELLAERIAVLGGNAQGTVRTVATQSTLPEYPSDLVEGTTHVNALAERFAQYAEMVRACITNAADVEDADTANIYTDISRGIDKRLRFLEAHLYL